MVKYICAILFAALTVNPANAWTHGQLPASTVDVYDTCLTTAQKADVSAWGGTLNVTTQVNNCIAMLPTKGGTLYFGAGRYIVTCGSLTTLSVPFAVVGEGHSDVTYDAPGGGSQVVSGLSQVECASTTASMFTSTATYGRFANISLVNTATSVSGAGVLVTGPRHSKVDYENVLVYGFFNGIDVQSGDSWSLSTSHVVGQTNCGLKVQNVSFPDEGDWSALSNTFYPANNALAGICYYSAGGGKMIGNKILPNAASMQFGIYMNVNPAQSQQTVITSNLIEGTSSYSVEIIQGWHNIIVADNFMRVASGAVFDATTITNLVVKNNQMLGTGDNPITMAAITNAVIEGNNTAGFNAPTVARLLSAAAMQPGTKAFVTDATTTTYGAAVTGSGGNAVSVYSDGTIWRIGG